MAGLTYTWGSWRFEPAECRLLREGTVVRLPIKTLDLLATLLERAPRLVTKAEIMAAVWPDATVEEGNIAFHVAALRKVLDAEEGPSTIETVRGRGYRFVQPVTIEPPPAVDLVVAAEVVPSPSTVAPPVSPLPTFAHAAPSLATVAERPHNRHVLLATALMLLAGVGAIAWSPWWSDRLSIAVQPFEIVNPSAGEETFPLGLVAYVTSTLQTAGIVPVPREAADVVLSGHIHPTVDGFQVNLQLTRTGDGARVWEWSFDVRRDDERPPPSAGPDDERSRLQRVIAARAAQGVKSYLSVNGTAR